MSNEIVSLAYTAIGIAMVYGWSSVLDEYIKFKTNKSLKDHASDLFGSIKNYRKV